LRRVSPGAEKLPGFVFWGFQTTENRMLETIAPPGATVTPGPLGVVDFGNIAALLGVSQQTLERLTRTDATFPKLFKIGNRRHCRFADIQSWIDRKAKGDA
jgi:predicted DNA-binding transcriptional regulator AlpA